MAENGCTYLKSSPCEYGVCESDLSCSDCPQPECVIGEESCGGGMKSWCVTGEDGCNYRESSLCPSGFCDGDDCGSCADKCTRGETFCSSGMLYHCVEDYNLCLDFGDETACATGVCADAVSCECVEDSTQIITCLVDGTKFQNQICTAKKWIDDGECLAIAVGSMNSIPGNRFWQGCRSADTGKPEDTKCYSNETPSHQVSVPSFKMDVYEVTNLQYIAFLNANKLTHSSRDAILLDVNGLWNVASGFENYPVVLVSWSEAKAYCEWAGKRLPSESEWELAARGTDDRLYPWGDERATCEYAVMDYGCRTESPYYWAVGSKPNGISPYGLFDMAGNVNEFVEDDWHDTYNGAGRPDDGSAWIGEPSSNSRIVRGGCADNNAQDVRASVRIKHYNGCSGTRTGFRCASDNN